MTDKFNFLTCGVARQFKTYSITRHLSLYLLLGWR